MRIFLTVIDSFGIGAMPDAALYGDEGADTYGHIYARTRVSLPNLRKLGLNNIEGIAAGLSPENKPEKTAYPLAAYARLSEITPAKDTTAGHYEIAGLALEKPYRVYPYGFPDRVVRRIEERAGCVFMGNEVASGTEIIQRLGEEHLRTGRPILYTSQDSVLQIAADVSVMPLSRLYEICAAARAVMQGDDAVGRVIARPFTHADGRFTRTKDRRDFALEPPGETMLDRLKARGIPVCAVGKIRDIFCGRGISESVHTGNNAEGLAALSRLVRSFPAGLVFANLVDTDMLYGHRNDAEGYAKALERIDSCLAEYLAALKEDDIFLLTADHGCDPTTPSTDHSREYVPLLAYGARIPPADLGTIRGFGCIADFILDRFSGTETGEIERGLRKAGRTDS